MDDGNISVKECGAVGDGVTNDTAAFNSAIAQAHALGADVIIPAGRYLLDPFTVLGSVTLRGACRGPFDSVYPLSGYPKGPMLLVNSGGAPFITLTGYNSSVKDIIIYYPNQEAPSAPSPTVYPWCISTDDTGPGHFIDGVTIVNAYDGIKVTTGRSGVRNCYIGAMHYGVMLDGIADYFTFDNIVHQALWDTWQNLTWPQPIDAWVMLNSVAFVVGRVDALIGNNVGIFARGEGFQFTDTTYSISPTNAYGTISNVDIDFVRYGVVAYSTNGAPGGIRFVNMNIGPCWAGNVITASGIAAILAQSGGNSAPKIRWTGGCIRGVWTASKIAVNAGSVLCSDVEGLNGIGETYTPPLPRSGVSYTAIGTTPFSVFISGGSVSRVMIDGVNTGSTNGTFGLLPGQTITLHYTSAPNWRWFAA